jgi:hypothetical protein
MKPGTQEWIMERLSQNCITDELIYELLLLLKAHFGKVKDEQDRLYNEIGDLLLKYEKIDPNKLKNP